MQNFKELGGISKNNVLLHAQFSSTHFIQTDTGLSIQTNPFFSHSHKNNTDPQAENTIVMQRHPTLPINTHIPPHHLDISCPVCILTSFCLLNSLSGWVYRWLFPPRGHCRNLPFCPYDFMNKRIPMGFAFLSKQCFFKSPFHQSIE